MRDFNFKDEPSTSAADIAAIRPLETPPEAVILDETAILDETPHEDTASLRPFHVETDEEESNNLPKIVGAAVIGLLIVGGGLYAYETTFAHQAPVKTVAMNTTAAPSNLAATTPQPSSTPDTSAPPPAATSAPAAPVKSATATPAPKSEPVKSEPVERSASNAPSNAPGVGIGPTSDPAINAPMTLTPDTAPPPQGSQTAAASPPAQTAMQQPITAPDVGNSSQPTASVAANQASGVTAPSDTAPASQPAPAVTPQPAQIQPAQIQPAPIQPSQPVQ